MFSPSMLLKLLAVATTVTAVPPARQAASNSLDTRQTPPVDFKQACEGFRPAVEECGLITATGTGVAWDGKNLGISGTDKVAVLFDSDCVMIGFKEWEPQSPTFQVEFDFEQPHPELQGGILTTHWTFKTSWIGENSISKFRAISDVDLFGEPEVFCGDTESTLEGVTAGWWRSCNFHCRAF